MPPIPTIAQAIRATRAEFDRVFLEAQAQMDPPILRKPLGSLAGGNLPDSEAFAVALADAQTRGYFDLLLHLIINDGLAGPSLTEEILAALAESSHELQQMTNRIRGFTHPDLVYRTWPKAIRWTAKVAIDGTPKGTGILIGPNLVLTVWHAVRELFEGTPSAGYRPADNAHTRLRVVFDDFLSFIERARTPVPAAPLTVPAHKQWCVIFSPCQEDELADRLPEDLALLDGAWDYAVIRLAQAPGLERGWARFDDASIVPRAQEPVVVFQFPATQPLRTDQGMIAAATEHVRTAVPSLRFLHSANTLGGSSGGPCFDRSSVLFGLHQGVWSTSAGNGQVLNRGIPIVRVLRHYREQLTELPALDPSEDTRWTISLKGLLMPVLGTGDFQRMVWRIGAEGPTRILVIDGDRGSGKTFSVRLLEAILPDIANLKITLDAQSIGKMDPIQLAHTICAQAGAPPPSIPPLAEGHTTAMTWLKDSVVDAIIKALDEVRQGRVVWLSITDLDIFTISGPLTPELLHLIYAQTTSVSWLRIVLDGMSGDIPAALRRSTERYTPPPPSREAIAAWLRRLRTEAQLTIDDMTVAALSDWLLNRYQRAASPLTAYEELALDLFDLAEAYGRAAEPP